MEYIVLLVLIIIVIGWFSNKFKSKSKGSSKLKSIIQISDKKENNDGFSADIKGDVFYELRCQFYNNGSPWVDIYEIKEGFDYRYNVKTSRWKDGNSPVIPEYQRKLTSSIKDEWQKAWAYFGKPVYNTERRKPAPLPTHVEYSKLPIILEYNFEELSSLPSEYSAKGSTGSIYKMTLRNLECTCADFIKRRSHYPMNDIRRICKHQARAIIDLKKNTKLTNNFMIQAFVRGAAEAERGIYRFKNFYEIKINEEINGPNPFYLFILNDDHPWAEVIFFTKKSYTNHGYHLKEMLSPVKNGPTHRRK